MAAEEAPPPPLQFGIEIEFLAPLGPQPPGPSPLVRYSLAAERCFRRLALAVQAAGLPAAYELMLSQNRGEADTGPGRALGDLMVLDPRTVAGLSTGETACYRYWTIKPEDDLGAPWGRGGLCETELSTPILPETELTKRHLAGVRTALEAIHDAHPDRVSVNPFCGLHVHVSPASGLTARHAQRVATLVFLIDHRLLFRLCAASRRRRYRPMGHNARFVMLPGCALTSEEQASACDAERHYLPAPLMAAHGRALGKLWAMLRIESVASQLYSGDAGEPLDDENALLVRGHRHPDRSVSWTVEFRHAQASFSSAFVRHWTGLVLTIVKVALLPRGQYRAVLERLWNIIAGRPSPDDAWRPLLQALKESAPSWGYDIDVEYWSKQVESYRTGPRSDVGPNGEALLDRSRPF